MRDEGISLGGAEHENFLERVDHKLFTIGNSNGGHFLRSFLHNRLSLLTWFRTPPAVRKHYKPIRTRDTFWSPDFFYENEGASLGRYVHGGGGGIRR